jgi:hypothetical protein
MLLDRVVGQMHELVRKVFDAELAARCAQVSFFVEVAFVVAVNTSD